MKRRWKYKISQRFSDTGRDYIIVGKELRQKQYVNHKSGNLYTKTSKWYKFHCLRCGWTNGWINEGDITKGVGCGCCRGLKVVPGINDIATKRPDITKYLANPQDATRYSYATGQKLTIKCPKCGQIQERRIDDISENMHCLGCSLIVNARPDLIDYLVNKEDANKYTYGSHTKIQLKCKDCGFEKSMTPHELSVDGFGCPVCSDGRSFPEKFIRSVFEQLSLKFVYQLDKQYFKWCANKKYDFYLPEHNCIVEIHGGQHYNVHNNFGVLQLQDVQKNDLLKRQMAQDNGIDKYIIINASKSELQYLKQSITNALSDLFDLTNIDWIQCNRAATHSYIIDVYNFYVQNLDMDKKEMAKKLNISYKTLTTYIRTCENNNIMKGKNEKDD